MPYAHSICDHVTPAIQALDLVKRIGGRILLGDVALTVRRACIFGLAGLNGAGKSTLLKSIVGLLPVDRGSIRIFGTAHLAKGARARLSYMPERFAPSRHLTGMEFVRYMLAIHAQPYSPARLRRMMELFELPRDALERSTRALSKGTAQKLGLLACLLPDKELYVLDEPTSGLDVLARSALKRQLRALRGQGCTILLSTHAIGDILELCDDLAVIGDGRILYEGETTRLLSRCGERAPEHAFLDLLHRPMRTTPDPECA